MYLEGLEKRSGLRIELNIPSDFGRLAADVELAIFRLVQECLTNIHRHSGSKTAVIRIRRESDKIYAEVQDRERNVAGTIRSSILGAPEWASGSGECENACGRPMVN